MRRVAMVALLLCGTAVRPALAQRTAQPPRFWIAGTDSGTKLVEANPIALPVYRKKIGVHLHDVSRREALRQLAQLSGLQFVFANDLIPVETVVRLDANDITVMDALTEVLRGGEIDVVVSPSGNAVLVRRRTAADASVASDTVRGRITSEGGALLAGAQVIITRGPDRAVFRATSGQDGRYEVVVDSGTGDYLVYIAAPPSMHAATFRKRVTRTAPGEHAFVVDAMLQRQAAAPQLATVTVRETNPKPRREDDRVAELSGAEVAEAAVAAALLPDQRGDLNAVGGTMPGVTPIAGGFSVLGLSSAQNTVTLNGLSFPSTSMPREAMATRRLVTSTYDPSRGWFGGADTRVTLSHDFLYSGAYATTSLDRPWMQGGDAIASRMGQRFGNLLQSAGVVGFLANERLSYNVSAQASRRSTSMSTVEDLDGGTLGRLGTTTEATRAILRIADSLHVPLHVLGTGPDAATRSASLLAGVSSLSRDRFTFEPKKQVGAVTIFAAHDGTDGGPLSPLKTSSTAGSVSRTTASLQASLSTFVTPEVLHEVRTGLSVTDQRTTPNLAMPAASVLTESWMTTGGNVPLLIEMGGAADDRATARRLTWETQSDTRFYAFRRAEHRARLSLDVRLDDSESRDGANYFGRYTYNSVADFAANRPVLFSRTLGEQRTRGSAWNAYLALGDYWKVSRTFELLYGLRVEGNAVTTHLANAQSITDAFGVRTDYAPRTLHVSPRLGFTWGTDHSGVGGATLRNPHGVFVRPMIGVLRGGIGEFRSLLSPTLFAATPALGTIQQITCVGNAVPTPDWNSFLQSTDAIPQQCVGGGAPSVWQSIGVSYRFVGRGYAPPRSWRANLAWSAQHESLVWSIEGVYALNLDQPSVQNLNFSNVERFTLADEGHRPVFVPVASIDPSSGLSTDMGSRRAANLGTVLQQGSEARSLVRQVTLTISPSLERVGKARFYGSVAYTLATSRALSSGFDGSTFGSPVTRTWASGTLTPRHAIIVQASAKADAFTFSLFGRFASGLRYTPMIAGDVNGDGLSNDRAFIFDPSTANDAGLPSGLQSLLLRAPSSARRCLRSQLGGPAAANSCKGPWTASTNAVVQLRSGALGAWSDRFNISLYVANPLAGIDQVLHGSNLRGWGDPSYPDPILLRVTGFDGAARRYRYEANPMFGSTRSSNVLFRMPWRITMDIRLSLGPSADQQVLDHSLKQGRGGRPGKKRTADETKRFYTRIMPDPFASVLQLTDSLMLTMDQVRSIMEGQARFNARKDTVITEFSAWLANLPDQYDAAEALRRQTDIYNSVLNLGREEIQGTLRPVLNRIQLRLLPWPADVMFRATGPLTIRDIRRQ